MPEEQKEAAATEPAKAKGGGMMKLLIVVGAVAIVEAGVLWTVFSMFAPAPLPAQAAEGGDAHAADDGHGGGGGGDHGEGGHHIDGADPTKTAGSIELPVLTKFRAPNDKSGRLFIYDFDIKVKARGSDEEALTALIEGRAGELADRIARIVRAADPSILGEADLKTLRIQIHRAIAEVCGEEELFTEVLIPRWVPLRSD